VLNAIEGHLVSGYADGGDMPTKPLELVPGAREDAEAFLIDRVETHERLERVGRLVNGFESPFGLELLTTAHWVVVHEGAQTDRDVIDRAHHWGPQKQQFSVRQIGLALEALSAERWIAPVTKAH
jgi:hypothetical protein